MLYERIDECKYLKQAINPLYILLFYRVLEVGTDKPCQWMCISEGDVLGLQTDGLLDSLLLGCLGAGIANTEKGRRQTSLNGAG
jgi:hypothetical protein